MIHPIRWMGRWLTCIWATRRIHRRIDADPSAPLSTEELIRLEAHLAVCAYCTGRYEHYRRLREELRSWAVGRPDTDRTARVEQRVRRSVDRERAS